MEAHFELGHGNESEVETFLVVASEEVVEGGELEYLEEMLDSASVLAGEVA